MEDVLRWVLAVVLAVFGVGAITTNLACLVIAPFLAFTGRRPHGVSMIPLFGGVSLALGLLIWPTPGVARYAWLPLVIDPGCLLTILLLGSSLLFKHGNDSSAE